MVTNNKTLLTEVHANQNRVNRGFPEFIHVRTFFTLADTTSRPKGEIYLHARMFCTLAHTSSIPMGALYL